MISHPPQNFPPPKPGEPNHDPGCFWAILCYAGIAAAWLLVICN